MISHTSKLFVVDIYLIATMDAKQNISAGKNVRLPAENQASRGERHTDGSVNTSILVWGAGISNHRMMHAKKA